MVTHFIWGSAVFKFDYFFVGFLLLVACNNRQAPQNTAENLPDSTIISAIESPTNTKPIPPYKNGSFCFKNILNQDVTNVQLVISGNNITGLMNWIPYQKDSARGTLAGIINADNELDLLFDYMIEGNKQTETTVMKIENEKLMFKKGELIDPNNDGHLVYKNVSQAKFDEGIEKADCKSLTQ